MKKRHCFQWPWQTGRALIALLLFGGTISGGRAATFVLEGTDKGSPNWSTGNLLAWQELDYIPSRVRITGGPVASQIFTISFPRTTETTPGFENFYSFVASSNVVFLSPPTLSSPANGDWSYSFTVQVTNSSTATIQFLARMAAGSHTTPGTSLQLSGDPASMGNLQVQKPAPGSGAPDLAIRKSGPASVPRGGILTYTLSYTNQAATDTAVGAQISDILPPGVTVLTNTLGANARFAGDTIFWDLTNVAAHAAGEISFQALLNPLIPVGAGLTNFAQILSSENDARSADNASILRTTVDPADCSLANGGAGNTSQGGINFSLAFAHLGDIVQVFPSLGMASNACTAINATGLVFIASGLLTNFLVNVTLAPGELISCPGNVQCKPGPYNITLTPDLVGASVVTPLGISPGIAGKIRAVENGLGTVLSGEIRDKLSDFHSATIQIVTPCIQVFQTCDRPPGQDCFSSELAVRFRGYVTNCGDITLTNVMVMDDRAGALQLFDPSSGLALINNVTLAPGAYAVFSNSFMPSVEETCAGGITNVVTATGTDTTAVGGPRASVTNTYTASCAICFQPRLVVAQACPPGAVAPGAVLTFTGTVTNTGNVTLTNVTVVNNRLLTNGGNLVASFPALAPGEFRSFSGGYLVPTNLCAVMDTLTAQGTTLCGGAAVSNSASAACAVTNTPRLALASNCPAVPLSPNQLLVFTGTVTNIGDVAVTNIVIVNSLPTNHSPVLVVTRLEPGEGTNYSGSYMVPANACGSLTDTLTATGFDVCGTIVTTNLARTCTVTDNQNPGITCPVNLVLAANAGQCRRSNVTFTVSATDDCSVTNLTSSPTNGSTFPVGVTTVTSTATDASGNQSSCNFTVTVTDNQGPVITCSTNLVLTADAGQCGRSNVTFTVGATDNCSVTNLVSTPPSGSTFPIGTTTVTNTATDASGNTASCSFTVTVTDNQNPVLTCSSNLVLTVDAGQCSRSNVIFLVSAADNCSVTNLASSPPSGSTFPVGTTTVTTTATDASGHQSSCSFTVTVTDTELPTLTCPPNRVVSTDAGRCFATGVSLGVPPATNDNCAILTVTNNAPAQYPKGVTTVTWTVVDTCGNFRTCPQTVTVNDTEQPSIICPAVFVQTNDPGQCSRSNVTYPLPFFSDNCSGATLVQIAGLPSGSTFPVGVTTNRFTVTDISGNQSSCTFSVQVTENQNPMITCPGNLSLTADAVGCHRSNVTFTVSATDNCGVTNLVSNPASGSTFPIGTTTVTSTATDASGNQSSCSFLVSVSDGQPPQITCLVNKTVDAGQSWTFDEPTATDNCGNPTISVANTATNPACGRTFAATRTWRATDAGGNFSECSQVVTVVDTTAPVVTILSPASGVFYLSPASFTLLATASDFGGAIAKVEFFNGSNKLGEATAGEPYFIVLTNLAGGDYLLIARAVDGCGLAATSAPVNITVIDRPPLTILRGMRLNLVTGLYEQLVRVSNPTDLSFEAVRVYVEGLSANATVHNATGTTNGVPFVQSVGAVPPQGYVDFVIEYFTTGGVVPIPILRAEALRSVSPGPLILGTTRQPVKRGLFLPGHSFLVEFATLANRIYYVQYSSDLIVWKTALPSVTGNGTWYEWVDGGQPKTESPPSITSQRFYRVILVP